jgi:hypothetical protein
VERALGEKDPDKIREFVARVRAIGEDTQVRGRATQEQRSEHGEE